MNPNDYRPDLEGYTPDEAFEAGWNILQKLLTKKGPVAIVDGKVRRLELTGAGAIASDLSQQPTYVLGPEVES